MTWRDEARPLVREAIDRARSALGESAPAEKVYRDALKRAPHWFGPIGPSWLRFIWRSEARAQLGLPKLSTGKRKSKTGDVVDPGPDPRQVGLFGGAS